jgi:hypothetical protein
MKKKTIILSVLSCGWLISGCTTVDVLGARNCVSDKPPDACTGNSADPKVTLNLVTMKANPPNVCAERGQTIKVKLVPEPDKLGSVAVVPKNFLDVWLIGTNSVDKGKIEIHIPEWVSIDDHDYGFVTSDGKCADPRAKVVK